MTKGERMKVKLDEERGGKRKPCRGSRPKSRQTWWEPVGGAATTTVTPRARIQLKDQSSWVRVGS